MPGLTFLSVTADALDYPISYPPPLPHLTTVHLSFQDDLDHYHGSDLHQPSVALLDLLAASPLTSLLLTEIDHTALGTWSKLFPWLPHLNSLYLSWNLSDHNDPDAWSYEYDGFDNDALALDLLGEYIHSSSLTTLGFDFNWELGFIYPWAPAIA